MRPDAASAEPHVLLPTLSSLRLIKDEDFRKKFIEDLIPRVNEMVVRCSLDDAQAPPAGLADATHDELRAALRS